MTPLSPGVFSISKFILFKDYKFSKNFKNYITFSKNYKKDNMHPYHIFLLISTFSRLNTGTVIPPLNITVAIVIKQVVVKNICRISLTVLRIDNAKAIAPRRPANHNKC